MKRTIVFGIILSLCVLPLHAASYYSKAAINSGSDTLVTTNYKGHGVLGQTITGQSSSASYINKQGIAYFTLADTFTVTQPPLPVQNLTATAINNAMVRLDWDSSPSSDVAKYFIYYDSATGSINWNTPIDTVTTLTWTSSTLVTETWYRFGVKAVDSDGEVDEGMNVVMAKPRITVTTTVPSLSIINPRAGKILNGQYANIHAQVKYGSVSSIKYATFQYSIDSGVTWVNMLPHSSSKNTNPDYTHTGSDKYICLWDISDLNDGHYMLRALAVTTTNDTDQYANPILVEIGGDTDSMDKRQWPDIIGENEKEGVKQVKKVYQAAADTVLLINPKRNDAQDEVKIPANVLTSEIDQIQVIFSDTVYYDTWLKNAPFTHIGELRRIELRSGQKIFNDNIEIYMSFPDNNSDGYVDSYSVKNQDLSGYYLDNSDSTWHQITTTLLENDKKRVKISTKHFTLFALGVAIPVSNNVSTIKVYPNPFVPYDNDPATGIPYGTGNYNGYIGGVVFTEVPPNTTIKIFTILGELVDEFYSANSNDVVWDAKNKAGREVASGTYIWSASGPGGRKNGNIFVIR